ncbi:PKD domain-containing protein [Pleionea sediminis]|uniref:PKD domain-containing protein n=1 Tax=Pleionea sediminis TaxID=2569479 RepID=UPI00118669F7|nr:PKD domain-containing protein [Pleionea sediminis]
MKKLKLALGALFMGIAVQSANAEITPENEMNVLYQGNDYLKLKIDERKYNELFRANSSEDEGLSHPKLMEDKEIYAFYSLAGVRDSDIPQSLKDEIIHDKGFRRWSEISQRELNAKTTIALDLEAALASENSEQRGLCDKVWKNKSKTISKVLTPQSSEVFDFAQNGVTGSLNVNLNSNGSVILDIHYKMKKNKCIGIYYKVEYLYTRVRANSNLAGSGIGLEANVAYEFNKKLFDEDVKIPLLRYDNSWWVYIFEIGVDLEVYAKYNVSLDAKLSAAFEVEQPMTGHVNIDWHCTNDGCRKDVNDVEYEFTSNTERNFELIADVTLRPYIKLIADVAVDLYWGLIDIAKVEVGVVGSIPIRYYGYFGNMCSDADGDGRNEEVTASMIDVAAEIYMYYKFRLINRESTYPVDLGNLGGWDERDDESVLLSCSSWIVDTMGGCDNVSLYGKSLYFKDFIDGGSNIFDPVINVADEFSSEGDFVTFSARSCYPFTNTINLLIDWDDGAQESKSISPSGDAFHYIYSTAGNKQIKAKMTGDSLGRQFNGQWIQKDINVVAKPEAEFTYSVDYQTVDFNDLSTDSDGYIQSWSWSFGDGNHSNSQNPSHRYASEGSYSVSLTVVDNDGFRSTYSKTVTVVAEPEPPEADFSYVIQMNGHDVTFMNNTRSDLDVVDYRWDFGDGTRSSAANTTHHYFRQGDYRATLTVTNAAGQSDSVSRTIRIRDMQWETLSVGSEFELIGGHAGGELQFRRVKFYQVDLPYTRDTQNYEVYTTGRQGDATIYLRAADPFGGPLDGQPSTDDWDVISDRPGANESIRFSNRYTRYYIKVEYTENNDIYVGLRAVR